MTKFFSLLFVLCAWTAAAAAGPGRPNIASPDAERPNVLFIAVDDLRPRLGCYGIEGISSPNIDRLASGGIVFERSYCMVPTCGASRSSLMTGIRPSPGRFVTFLARADEDAPGVTTLNTHFKSHGYHTVSLGKIFHWRQDSAPGWSEPAWRPRAPSYRDPENARIQRRRNADSRQRQGQGRRQRRRGPAYESADVADEAYGDGLIARRAVEDLRRLSKRDEPFFLAVGFFKPHLPFVAPKKYWDLYDREKIKLPKTYHRPKDAPDAAIHRFGELRAYAGVPARGPLSDELARTLIHGYSACVSYTDAQVGRVLDELDRLGLAKSTIVVLWGDHGWNLGEHTLWCKHCTFETSMRAPLIVRAPGIAGARTTRGLTEFIDIYPSLCELAGLPKPDHLEGKSFVPLLKDPSLPWKDAAIGRFKSGDTIRTDRYRFTEYTDRKGEFVARMLYDHEADPDEDVNVSEHAKNQRLVVALTADLRERKGVDFNQTTGFPPPSKPTVAIRRITSGPSHHFFGYIGQVRTIPWNASGRYIAALRTSFQDRMPTPKDAADIVLLDCENDYAARVIDRTRAWNPQQGTMMYWNPRAAETQLFFNDRDSKTGKVFCVLYDVEKRRRIREYRFEDAPIGNGGVCQQGGQFAAINYGRIARLRPVTGYPEAYDWTVGQKHPADDGVFLVDIATGTKRLVASFKQMRDLLVKSRPDVDEKELFINHTLWSRDGERLFFFARGDFSSRDRTRKRLNVPFVVRVDGTGLKPLPHHFGGHPEWDEGSRMIGRRDKAQAIYDVELEQYVGTLGDPSIFPNPEGDIALSPDGTWLVNGWKRDGANHYAFFRRADGYAVRSDGIDKGQWTGELRVDGAPCWNRDGTAVVVPGIASDGTRQMFLISLETK